MLFFLERRDTIVTKMAVSFYCQVIATQKIQLALNHPRCIVSYKMSLQNSYGLSSCLKELITAI
jgi:hypothetical protein